MEGVEIAYTKRGDVYFESLDNLAVTQVSKGVVDLPLPQHNSCFDSVYDVPVVTVEEKGLSSHPECLKTYRVVKIDRN